MLAGCLAVLIASAATTTAFVLGQLDQLAGALSVSKSVDIRPAALAHASAGGPQTLLLVGNDQRNHTTTAPVLPHSNEMLLVRFDPSKPWISMMSIPRELMVTIDCPGGPVTTRFNYSLTCGGFKMLVATIKQVTGLSVNHVVMIDFNEFKQAVDDIGCVYATVDRRYFHVNTPTSAQYQQINLQAGYQQLCGTQALEFVSYRHGDTSLVRDARDQSFLLAVKQEYGPTLIDNIGRFEQVFGRTVQTDASLHSASGLLDLIDTLVSSAGLPVRQVQFQANLAPTNPLAADCACVTATPGQIEASVHSFLYGGGLPSKRRTAQLAHAISHQPPRPQSLELEAAASGGPPAARSAAARLPFGLELPRVQDELGPATPPEIRDYLIHAPGGTAYPIYVEVFSTGLLGQYYDVQGTTWVTAPTFDAPAQTVALGGRQFSLWYTGAHLDQVAWFERGAMYWIRNTLTDALGNAQMLEIAEQTTPVTAAPAARRGRVDLRTLHLAAPVTEDASSAVLPATITSLAGLVTLLLLPLAAGAVVLNRRRLTAMHGQLRGTVARAALLEAQLATVAGAQSAPPAPAPIVHVSPVDGPRTEPRHRPRC